MGNLDSTIYKGKSVEKTLNLVFDEGDDVLAGIKNAIRQHNIREASALNAEGQLKDATINYFNKSRFVSTDIKNGRIVSCSGRFMNLKDGVIGDMHVGFMLGMQMWDGTLVKAVAAKGFELTLKFYQNAEDAAKEAGLSGVKN
ncbi:MAG: DNA-binding protein [Candidatus Diapherotrites archaeon]|uniref:DNA-binding protein n=1 Tax=Candidatus Iainarchaeum sp. TaxID=3101447 RepID=A0A8T4C8K8_9ARCH|nr:DNA-binding protein [Candidatus Diapherotrites archaeon]